MSQMPAPMTAERLAKIAFQPRAGARLHACPCCDIGRPGGFCQVCLGTGLVDDERLDRYMVSIGGRAE